MLGYYFSGAELNVGVRRLQSGHLNGRLFVTGKYLVKFNGTVVWMINIMMLFILNVVLVIMHPYSFCLRKQFLLPILVAFSGCRILGYFVLK